MADKHVHKRKPEVEDRLFYHERRLPPIAVRFKYDFLLSSLDEAVTATREAFGYECLNPPPGGVVLSAPTAAGDHEGDWDFGDIPSGWSPEREQCHMILCTM